MQPALDHDYILARVGEEQLAAVAHVQLGRPTILLQQRRRKVHALQRREAKLPQGRQAVSAPAEQLNHAKVLAPGIDAKSAKAIDELGHLLSGRLKAGVGSLPLVILAGLAALPVNQFGGLDWFVCTHFRGRASTLSKKLVKIVCTPSRKQKAEGISTRSTTDGTSGPNA